MSSSKKFPEGLIGKKIGMTQIYTQAGEAVPVTAIEVGPCFVLQVKTHNSDGYSAVQLGFGSKQKVKNFAKAELGHFKKADKGAFEYVRELRCDVEALGWGDLGKEIKVQEVFQDGELVDVAGVSLGRGFAGVVRRHKVKGQPATRGTHEYRRHIGAIGCRKYPGRVFKNKRMPGHMGNENVTIQNLKVVGVNAENNLLLVRGGIPGHVGGLVMVRKAIKSFKASDNKEGAKKAA